MKDYLKITLSAIVTAIAVKFFFIHNGLAPGGITGLALVTSSITNIKVETMSLVISIPMLAIAVFLLGKNFGLKTLYITIMTPLFMKVVPAIWVTKSLVSISPILEYLVSGTIAGILIGIGISIALNAQCATGGTDVLALIIQYFIKNAKLSNIILMLDGLIIISSGIVTSNWMISIFSLVSLLVIIQTIKICTNPRSVA